MNEQQVSESILALASAVAGEDLTGEGDGTKATALSVLGSVVGEIDSDTALYNAAQFATRRSTDTKDAAASVLALSQGGGGSSKELLFEETVTTAADEVSYAWAKLAYSQPIDADTIYVTFDGVAYTCPKRTEESDPANYYGSDVTFSELPFGISSATSEGITENVLVTQTAGTHAVKVEVEGSGGGSSLGQIINVTYNGAGTSLALFVDNPSGTSNDPIFLCPMADTQYVGVPSGLYALVAMPDAESVQVHQPDPDTLTPIETTEVTWSESGWLMFIVPEPQSFDESVVFVKGHNA